MTGFLKSAKDSFEYEAMRIVLAVVAALPWRTGRQLAVLVADLYRTVGSRTRRARAARNLKASFPDLTEQQIQRIVRDTYRNLAISLVDAFQFFRFIPGGTYMDFVEAKGFEQLAQRPPGTGVIFVTGHFGCWEILAAVGAAVGFPVCALFSPLNNPHLNAYVLKLRESALCKVISKRGTMRQVLGMIRAGTNVAFLIDQDARRDGIFVDFFGRPAATVGSVAKLSLYTGAPVGFVYVTRISDLPRFRVELKDVINPRQDARRQEETQRITQRFTKDLEEVIRESPEQWLWLHNRWKTYPGKYRKQ